MTQDFKQLWKECLKVISDNVDQTCYDTWFAPIVPFKYEKEVLTIQVPSRFFYEYLDSKFSELMRVTLSCVFGPNTYLKYRVVVDSEANGTMDEPAGKVAVSKKAVSEFDSHLNAEYDFDNFIEGACNKLPRTAGINIASQPGKTAFNPLFIYGKSGVGKTHLANAIGLKTKELHPQKKVLYVSANLFQLQYTEALRTGHANEFLNFYQMVDVLIVDDVHEFGEGKKQATQNAFFSIFNYLHQMGKQLIFTCDKKPAELEGFEPRLLSRFQWGLTAEMTSPDVETRKSILRQLVAKDGLSIPANVIDYLAEHITENVRSLEGAVISLIAQSTINQRPVNLELAKQVVGNLVHVTEKQHTVLSIRDVVCDYFKIPVESLLSSSRKREIVQARQIAMYFSKQLTKDSLTTIGTTIGNRNHATVLHACKTVKDLIDTDKYFRSNVEDIERKLKS
ncbi:MAG: chromosomal replication initiator protein DnaA [Paludibacteraceae bacterium]|nr:chromosomal replication initiator protein DnaA [Paludibacteraceae bacterium]